MFSILCLIFIPETFFFRYQKRFVLKICFSSTISVYSQHWFPDSHCRHHSADNCLQYLLPVSSNFWFSKYFFFRFLFLHFTNVSFFHVGLRIIILHDSYFAPCWSFWFFSRQIFPYFVIIKTSFQKERKIFEDFFFPHLCPTFPHIHFCIIIFHTEGFFSTISFQFLFGVSLFFFYRQSFLSFQQVLLKLLTFSSKVFVKNCFIGHFHLFTWFYHRLHFFSVFLFFPSVKFLFFLLRLYMSFLWFLSRILSFNYSLLLLYVFLLTPNIRFHSLQSFFLHYSPYIHPMFFVLTLVFSTFLFVILLSCSQFLLFPLTVHTFSHKRVAFLRFASNKNM